MTAADLSALDGGALITLMAYGSDALASVTAGLEALELMRTHGRSTNMQRIIGESQVRQRFQGRERDLVDGLAALAVLLRDDEVQIDAESSRAGSRVEISMGVWRDVVTGASSMVRQIVRGGRSTFTAPGEFSPWVLDLMGVTA